MYVSLFNYHWIVYSSLRSAIIKHVFYTKSPHRLPPYQYVSSISDVFAGIVIFYVSNQRVDGFLIRILATMWLKHEVHVHHKVSIYTYIHILYTFLVSVANYVSIFRHAILLLMVFIARFLYDLVYR